VGPIRQAFYVRVQTHFAHTPIRILQNTLSDIAFGFEKPYEQNDCLVAKNVRLVAFSLLIILTSLAWVNCQYRVAGKASALRAGKWAPG